MSVGKIICILITRLYFPIASCLPPPNVKLTDALGTYCHACLNKIPKPLSDRWHLCCCGVSFHPDKNSAKFQKSVGLGLNLRKIAPREPKKPALSFA